ncbi:MAG: transporter substrate-binding domain-containing protein [Desulfobacula sp.]|nr:transporter substrate-binding domain-containing protein [Desulfobacula sp.]
MGKTIFLISLLFMFLYCPSISSQETITIATGDWPPLLEEQAKHYGYANHMLKLSFATQGIDCKFIFLPWKRAYELSKYGKYNVTNYWLCTKKRQKDFFCGEAIITESYVLFHLKTMQLSWDTFNDLKPYKTGLTLGYTYTDEFVKMFDNKELEGDWVSTDTQNFKKLITGRIDIFPIPESVGLYILNRDFPPEQRGRVTYHHRPIVTSTNHPLFPKSRKDSEKYLKLFNKGFKILKKNGTLDEYYEKMIMGWYTK